MFNVPAIVWKLGGGLLVAITIYITFTAWLSGVKKESYNNGFTVAEKQIKDLQKKETEKNKKITEDIRLMIQTFGKQAVEKAIDRNKQQNTYKETIIERVKNNPIYSQCVADEETIKHRNAVRAMGPEVTIDIGDTK